MACRYRQFPRDGDGVGGGVLLGVGVFVGVIDILGVMDGVLLGVFEIETVGVGLGVGGTNTTVFEYPLCKFGQHCLSLKYQFEPQVIHPSTESIVI